MRILGIDPGLTRCGAGVITVTGPGKFRFEHVEVLQTSPRDPLARRLAILGNGISSLLQTGQVEAVALERVFAQQNLPSVMGVAQVSGVVLYLAENAKIPVTLYTPNEVKSRVTGYGAANKDQVTNMVMRHLHLSQPPKPADAADALALAITHALSAPSYGSALRTHPHPLPRSQSSPTPAQQAWRAAERSTKRK